MFKLVNYAQKRRTYIRRICLVCTLINNMQCKYFFLYFFKQVTIWVFFLFITFFINLFKYTFLWQLIRMNRFFFIKKQCSDKTIILLKMGSWILWNVDGPRLYQLLWVKPPADYIVNQSVFWSSKNLCPRLTKRRTQLELLTRHKRKFGSYCETNTMDKLYSCLNLQNTLSVNITMLTTFYRL